MNGMVKDSVPETERTTKNTFHIDLQEYDLYYVCLVDALSHIPSRKK